MSRRIDLNADVGEGAGNDAAIVPYVTSVNIACGGHAGDERTMRETLALAARHAVAAGAHPGYPDRKHFGRVQLDMTPGEIHETVSLQVAALLHVADAAGVALTHVKPHGALYNTAAVDVHAARAIARAVRAIDAELLIYGLAHSVMLVEAESLGLGTVAEAFADRGYDDDGQLAPRGTPNALIDDPATAGERALRLVEEGMVRSVTGRDVRVHAGTICIHGDSVRAAAIVRRVREQLERAGVRIAAPGAS
jgi:5-oxoprolinase (ATP-hydrolysing) subunit A